MHVRSYSLKSKASFQLTEDGSKSPPFILKRQLQAEGEMTAQTSSSKVLPVAEGVFFFLPLSVNGEALGSLVVARQLHQDCCGEGALAVGLGGYDTQDTIARLCNLPKNPIRGSTFAALLCCCVRTIISSNMFHRNDKKETELQIQEVTFSLSWFVVATVTWCNKSFCNHGLFKPSDAVIKTTIIPLWLFHQWRHCGRLQRRNWLFFVYHLRNLGVNCTSETMKLRNRAQMLLIWLLGYCCG